MTSTRTLFVVPLVVLGAAVVAAGCIKKEEPPPEETKPAPPPAPPPEPPRSALKIDPGASYTIVGVGSSKCLQFVGANTDDARGEIRTCNASKAQQFHLQPVAGGYVSIVNALSGKCIDVGNESVDDSSPVGQFPCHGRANQNWIVADAGPDTIKLVARHSGKVLDVGNEDTADGALIGQYHWQSHANQQWRLKLVGDAGGAGGSGAGAGGAPGKDGGKGHKGGKEPKEPKEPKPAKPKAGAKT
jgi:hypothetical protein